MAVYTRGGVDGHAEPPTTMPAVTGTAAASWAIQKQAPRVACPVNVDSGDHIQSNGAMHTRDADGWQQPPISTNEHQQYDGSQNTDHLRKQRGESTRTTMLVECNASVVMIEQ